MNPVGVRCKMSCLYCYEHASRRACGNAGPPRVNHEAVQAQLLKVCGKDGFSLHGGEALIADPEDLEKLWAFGLEKYGKNGVQTSGADITEEHFALFKKYKVHVGFSIDGPEELNDPRRRGSLAKTREATARSIYWLRRCLREGVGASLITTLHAANVRGERLERLLAWFRELNAAGMTSARIHLMERDGPGGELLALSDEENIRALLAFEALERGFAPSRWARVRARVFRRPVSQLRFDLFTDMRKKLIDPSCSATCIWDWCDPTVTQSVTGIDGDGSRTGCGRDSKDGRRWEPLEQVTTWRQAALWATPQAEGGCRGCRFFLQCGGQCPGTAIGGDWRKRSVECAVWKAVFGRLEAEMVAAGQKPASLRSDLEQMVARRLAAPPRSSSGHGDHTNRRPYQDHTDARHHNVAGAHSNYGH